MRLIIFAIFLSTVFARPQPVSEDAVMVSHERESDESDTYVLFYQKSDLQTGEEQDVIKNTGTDNEDLSGSDPEIIPIRFLSPDRKFNSLLSRIATERSKILTE